MGTALRAVGNGMSVLIDPVPQRLLALRRAGCVKAFGTSFVLKADGPGVCEEWAERRPTRRIFRLVEAAWR